MASHDNKAKDYDDLSEGGKTRRNNSDLNKLLKELGLQSVTIDDEGNPITRFEQLAEYIWKAALGYEEEDKTTGRKIEHKPDKHFISMIYDRMHGRIPVSDDNKGKKNASVADKIAGQTVNRINSLND